MREMSTKPSVLQKLGLQKALGLGTHGDILYGAYNSVKVTFFENPRDACAGRREAGARENPAVVESSISELWSWLSAT